MVWRDRELWLNCLFLGDIRGKDQKERGEEIGELIMGIWDLSEFHVRVN